MNVQVKLNAVFVVEVQVAVGGGGDEGDGVDGVKQGGGERAKH
jgi:hypothetical protein